MAPRAQIILNEVYCSPGAGNHEFFELYNNSTGNTTASVDAITIVSYFEEGANTGYYVLDLPNVTIPARGFFVGSAAIPFNYQGITGSTSSDYSWNDLAYMAANNAYLKKWIVSNANPADGNAFYDEVAVPANLNDVFYRKGNGGASYSIMVYQNGVLLSAFFGGSGGGGNVPGFIVGMPKLFIDMTSVATDFEMHFQNASGVQGEFVIQDAGSDNGFMRTRDGICGVWDKSSANVYHTPKSSNGVATGATGEISVMHTVNPGNATNGSEVSYDVVGAPAYVFPVTLSVYLDNGTVPGQLDAYDTYIESNTEYTLSDGGFTTTFFPHDQDVMIVVNSAVGCIDKILFTPNAGLLPLQLLGFDAVAKNNRAELKWTVDINESGQQFIVERSNDGRNFENIATLAATHRTGKEQYTYLEANGLQEKSYYRLKIIDKNKKLIYSPIIMMRKGNTENELLLLQNPVAQTLRLNYLSSESGLVAINIYSMAGAKVFTMNKPVQKGDNSISFPIGNGVRPGMYVIELVSAQERVQAKFMKQ